MKKLLLTLISSLSILSTLSFATAQVKQASQYAKIETTEAGAPMVGNATELNFVCSGASSMVVTKSYTYNNTPVEIFNMALSPNVVFEKVLPAELGTRYDLTCKTDGKVAMTDSYKTPDFLPQAIRISADKTELNQGEKITIKSSTINGAFKYCDIYFDSNKAGILTGNMNTLTYSFDYSSMSAGSHNVYYKCSYSDNTVGTAMVNSNNLVITRNSDAATSPINIPYCSTLDVDGDGKVQALVDGILIQRSLNSAVSDSNILNGITLSPNSIRRTAADIRAFVNSNSSKYDVDGDGRSLAGIDAVLLVRYMLGITGDSFISGVPVASGVTYSTVLEKIKSNCQASTQMCTTVYKPVCGQPKTPVCTKDMACPQNIFVQQTYSNKCELDRAGATYLYDGVCTSDEIPAVTACPTGAFNLKDTCQCPTGQVLTRVGQDSTGRDLYSCLLATDASTTVQVSLSPTQPSGFVYAGQSRVKLAEFVFSGIGKVSAIKLMRTGVSSNNSITNISLVYGGNLIAWPANLSSDGSVSFSNQTFGLFDLESRVQNKTISVYADISEGTEGQSVGVSLVGFKVNTNPLSNNLLIGNNLNIMSSVAGSLELATLFGDITSDVNINSTTSLVSVWKRDMSANSPIKLQDANLRYTGSLSPYVPLFFMYIDGIRYGGSVKPTSFDGFSSAYVKFSDINSDITYGKHSLEIKAELYGNNAGRNFRLSLDSSSALGIESLYKSGVFGTVGGVTKYGTGGLINIVGGGVNICPTGVFTNSDCTCQNGQQPTAIPSGTRIQQFTCDVKDTACTDVYKPVCGQPKTCNSSLGYCLDVMQKPQTYSNICALTSAGATYLYDGTCDGAKTNLIQKSSTTPPTIPNIPNNNDVDNGDDNNTGGVCVSLTANMRFRSRDNSTGGEVSKLQNFLISSGYLTGSATGYFGNATQAAVKSYQAANGLAVSGIVGQYTRAKIVDGCSNSNSAVDEPLPLGLPDSTSTSPQPKADVITKIDMRSVSGGFVVSPVQVTNGVKMTAEFKTNDFRFDGQYYVRLMYKNSSRQCILTGSFQPIANKTYKIERTSESACVLGGNIGDLSNVDYFEIAKQ